VELNSFLPQNIFSFAGFSFYGILQTINGVKNVINEAI